MISIIVRSKNEERWITHCIKALQQQTYQDFEVILVDNHSTDRTVERAKQMLPELTLVSLDVYRPGAALNAGIRASQGDVIVCLSAHCIPVNQDWLAMLVAPLSEPQIAGVYGRQIPTQATRPADKRDLLITFGLDRRVQIRDSFFHNANSALRRDLWQQTPFDETVTNIEDRIWAQAMIEQGYRLVYEPDAPVYHHHGIHHTNDRTRYQNTARILDQLRLQPDHERIDPRDPGKLNIWAMIPLKRPPAADELPLVQDLLTITAMQVQHSAYISRALLIADDEEIANWGRQLGLEVPFLRPAELSKAGVRVDQVLGYALQRLEADSQYADLIVPLEVTYPFRPPQLLDTLIQKQIKTGVDSMIAGYTEYRPYWMERDEVLVRMDDFDTPRTERDVLHIGLPSLACVTYPEFVRDNRRLGANVGIHHLDDPIAAIEIRNNTNWPLFNRLRGLFSTTSQASTANNQGAPTQ